MYLYNFSFTNIKDLFLGKPQCYVILGEAKHSTTRLQSEKSSNHRSCTIFATKAKEIRVNEFFKYIRT